MKNLACALALAVCSLGHLAAQDTLVPLKNVVYTGGIAYPALDVRKGFTPVVLTKDSLVANFGGVSVKTADTDLFLNTSTGAITLEAKDHSRQYATLVRYADDDAKAVDLSAQSSTKARKYNQATFLGGSFTGAVMRTETSVYRPDVTLTTAKLQIDGSVTPNANTSINAILTWTLRYDVAVPVAPPVQ
jgi:hypothetical protein